VFTGAQAEAGRAAYENSCGRRHTYTLLGRNGAETEFPPLKSLPEPFLKFIGPRKHVPALIGKDFVMWLARGLVSAGANGHYLDEWIGHFPVTPLIHSPGLDTSLCPWPPATNTDTSSS
jgi:hypothetical protein